MDPHVKDNTSYLERRPLFETGPSRLWTMNKVLFVGIHEIQSPGGQHVELILVSLLIASHFLIRFIYSGVTDMWKRQS